mmetsp:Transcript_937/g.2269  ORF Transcript_937/g.2269 Transcript_937/m.2269 type:complete len:231 (+) Transcript_937:679-1371(+)
MGHRSPGGARWLLPLRRLLQPCPRGDGGDHGGVHPPDGGWGWHRASQGVPQRHEHSRSVLDPGDPGHRLRVHPRVVLCPRVRTGGPADPHRREHRLRDHLHRQAHSPLPGPPAVGSRALPQRSGPARLRVRRRRCGDRRGVRRAHRRGAVRAGGGSVALDADAHHPHLHQRARRDLHAVVHQGGVVRHRRHLALRPPLLRKQPLHHRRPEAVPVRQHGGGGGGRHLRFRP